MIYKHKRKISKLAFVSLLIVLALVLPSSASMNETGAMQAWIKSDQRANTSTNQTIISMPAEISDERGLMGLWHFDNGTGSHAIDSSGFNNNGTCKGGGGGDCNWTKGMFGPGILFDGSDDYVAINSGASVSGLSQVSLSAWFRTDVLDSSQNYIYGEAISVGGNDRFGLYINTDNKLFFGGRAPDTDAYTTWVDSTVTLTTDTWYHAVAIFDSSSDVHSIYVNGDVQTNSVSEPSFTASDPIAPRIGARGDSAEKFDGTIDEVAIFNRSLSAEEVRDHYLGYSLRQYSKRINNGSLVLLMHFDNDTKVGEAYNATNASFVYDYAGGRNNGTWISNATVPGARIGRWNLTNGKFGGGIRFDGDGDYVNVSDDSSLRITQGTFEAWVKPAMTYDSGLSNEFGIITKDRSGANEGDMILQFDDTGVIRYIVQGSPGISVDSDSASWSADTWYHVVVTFDDTITKMYIDGIQQADTGSVNDISDNTNALLFGNQLSDKCFNGTIDEVSIWNYALSSDEIREHYHTEGFYGNRTGFLRFHAGNWTLLKDISKWKADEWHFVGGSWSNSNLELYVDGKREWNYSKWRAAGKLGNLTYIGNSPANNSGFDGVIDEVSLWNRSLGSGAAAKEFDREILRYEVLISRNETFPSDNISYARLAINNFSQPLYRDDDYTVFLEHFDSIEAIGWNNGTVYGNFSICEGKFGSGGCFDGVNAYVEINSDSDLPNGTDDRTVEMWINAKTYTNNRLISYGAWSVDNAFDITTQTSGYIGVVGHTNNYQSTNTYSADTWYHLAVILDGGTLKIYVDGVLDSSQATTINTKRAGAWRIGYELASRGGSSTHYFNGTIDEVRITSGVARIPASQLPNSTHVTASNISDDGTYYWKIRPLNIDDRSEDDEQIYGEWSGVEDFYLDASPPLIYWGRPRDDNKSILGGWFFQNITVVDANLFWLNCTIYNSTGTDMWNTSFNLTNRQIYNLYNWTNISGWKYGIYTENCTVWDMTKKKT